jgi:type IV secretion system protein VirB10
MNRRPLMAVFGVFVLVMGVVAYTVMDRAEDAGVQRAAQEKKPDPASSAGVFDNAPNAGLIKAKELPPPPPPKEAEVVVDAHGVPQPRQPGDVDAYAQEWQQYRQQQGQVRQQQVQAAMSALSSSPAVGEFSRRGNDGPASAAAPSKPQPPDMAGVADRIAALAQQRGQAAQGSGDANNAKGKADWLNSAPNPANYLATGRQPLVSPFELKTGTVIPGVMIGGINSDLPGQIVAQVRENVWDTATGHHLLIPQGARLVGTYDNQVTRGQSRVLVAWTRIIYPDGSSVDLGTMPGADQGGYAGFSDKVNNHYVRVFGDALLMSLFSAGIQLSQPKSNDSMNGGYSSQQIIAASLGQQLGQAGMQITQRIWTFNQRSKSGRAIAST